MSASYVSISNIIIDDIVLHTGSSFMGILGGAGIHALSGMRLWTKEKLGIVASVGDDLPKEHIRKLNHMGVSLEGIYFRENQHTTRAWQIIEADERRIEIMRSDGIYIPGYQPSIEEIPDSFLNALGYHLHLDEQMEMFPELLQLLKQRSPNATIIWEPTARTTCYDPAYLEKLLPFASIFSPNLGEARLITGQENERDIVKYLFDHGANLLALRKGGNGSTVFCKPQEGWKIPAIAKSVIDVTGAGNAYCGGLMVSTSQGFSLAEAALRGAVSGSFEIEQFGIPVNFDDHILKEAQNRLDDIRARIEPVSF